MRNKACPYLVIHKKMFAVTIVSIKTNNPMATCHSTLLQRQAMWPCCAHWQHQSTATAWPKGNLCALQTGYIFQAKMAVLPREF